MITLDLDDGTSVSVSVVATAGQLPALARDHADRRGGDRRGGRRDRRAGARQRGGARRSRSPSRTVDLPGWVAAVSPTTGTIRPGGDVSVEVQLSAAGLGVGTYTTALIVSTNDPLATQVEVPGSRSSSARARSRAWGRRPSPS